MRSLSVSFLIQYRRLGYAEGNPAYFIEVVWEGGGDEEPPSCSIKLFADGQAPKPTSTARSGNNVPAKSLCANCFVAGTLVRTKRGMLPIEEVRVGDEVWTFDVRSGLWQWLSVEEVFSRTHDGLMVSLHAGGEVITATGRHPVWVVRGEALSQ